MALFRCCYFHGSFAYLNSCVFCTLPGLFCVFTGSLVRVNRVVFVFRSVSVVYQQGLFCLSQGLFCVSTGSLLFVNRASVVFHSVFVVC